MASNISTGASGFNPTVSNAALLLNPKAAKSSSKPNKNPSSSYDSENPRKSPFSTTSNGGGSVKSASDISNQEVGMGSLLEKNYKIEDRPERPLKRQKQSPNEDEDDDVVEVRKSTFQGGGGESGITEYFKEKSEEAQNGDGKAHTPIDLTIDGDEDLPLAIKENRSEEVCLGRIQIARVNAHRIPTPKMTGVFNQISNATWPAMKCELYRRPGGAKNAIISVSDPSGREFGVIDPLVAPALAPLMDGAAQTTKVRLQARLDSRKRFPYEIPYSQTSTSYKITINVYAQRKSVTAIGKWLTQNRITLVEPLAVDRGVAIVNPHMGTNVVIEQRAKSHIASTSRSTALSNYTPRTNEQMKEDVSNLLNSLGDTSNLPEMEATNAIVTPLLKHQKQALFFMTEREKDHVMSGDKQLWKHQLLNNKRESWYNVITGQQQLEKPEPSLGGILADVMGLGKTLSVLALLAATKEEAREWGRTEAKDDDNPEIEETSRATLLVCPLSTVVNWEDQVKAHLKRKAIKYTVYHGTNRTSDVGELADNDLVITTYSVVSADFDRRSRKLMGSPSPLFKVDWFRIVLDEAHMIREQTTRQSKAACALQAQRRWCLTGTPIQNRMDDLGALIKFLRIKPFDERGNFAQYITSPLKSADVDALPKLRVLVDSITLRRLKDKLDLPDRTEHISKLHMSDEERNLYEAFNRDSKAKFQAVVGTRQTLGGSSMAHILKAILRMRLLCAHGGELLSDADWDLAKGFSASHAIDLSDEDDEKEDRTPRQAFEMYRMIKDANMHICGRCGEVWVRPASEVVDSEESADEDENEDDTFGYLAPCNQLICRDCIPKFRQELKQRVGPDNYCYCTLCNTYIRVHFFELTQSALQKDEIAQSEVRKNPKLARHAGRYTGPHTKTKALMDLLKKDAEWNEANPQERPIKSVVFSGWTSHLDLIQIALTDAGIQFCRLDGTMTRAHRTAALDKLSNDPEICVILVSLTAGGLGLNLTAASRVYVMEPQFNPAAEAQAVERVHRLGQERDVVITKFIMHNSFEEKMRELQRAKEGLANLSLDPNAVKMDKHEAAKKKLEDLKHLFR